jgi:hypothetical protein
MAHHSWQRPSVRPFCLTWTGRVHVNVNMQRTALFPLPPNLGSYYHTDRAWHFLTAV